MLTITVPGKEYWDEEKEEFITVGDVVLQLEHSLVSLSKWESKFEKPFLGSAERTNEEAIGYIEAMIVTPDFPPDVLSNFTEENIDQVQQYINAKMTATWLTDDPATKPSREIVTAEIIYYWMIGLNIPVEFENWHLNRLLTLIKVVNAKNSPAKKLSPREAMAKQRELNDKRRRELGTKG